MANPSLKILIIDDEEIVGFTLELFIKSLGHTSTWALNAEDGRQVMQQKVFDLLILDIRLPGKLTSYDLIDWMHQNNIHIPIIVISGHGDQEVRQQALDLGAKSFLDKPFSIEELNQEINALINSPK